MLSLEPKILHLTNSCQLIAHKLVNSRSMSMKFGMELDLDLA